MECLEIRKRFDQLAAERHSVESVWEVISRFVVPLRGEFFRDIVSEQTVEWRNRHKFDDTAVDACNTLAASIQGALTSPVVRWFDLQFRDKQLNHDAEASAWLRECSNIEYQELIESNFNLQAAESYLDICSFGTTLIVEEVEERNQKFENLLFSAVPVQEGYFEEDYKQQVLRFYRKHMWTPAQIISKFGEENVPEYIKVQAVNAGTMETKHKVVFSIFDRPEKKDADVTKILAPKERPYGYKYVMHKDAVQLGDEGGYYDMPVFATRWNKAAGSKWGFSPAHLCLGDILTLNKLVEMILVAAAKVIDPATLSKERSIIGDLHLDAGGNTVVRDIKGVVPYESKARFDVSHLEKRDLQDSIRKTFKVDQLELKESPAMTATEVQVRYELMQRLLGPTLGRLQNDFLDPLIKRTFFILLRAGRFPDPPKAVAEQGADMDIEYTGPLARAQKMEKITSMQRWFSFITPIAEVKPEILDLPDVDEVGREAAQLLDVPLVPEAKVDKIRKERDEAMKRRQSIEENEAAGKAMSEYGTGLQAINGGAGGGETPERNAATEG